MKVPTSPSLWRRVWAFLNIGSHMASAIFCLLLFSFFSMLLAVHGPELPNMPATLTVMTWPSYLLADHVPEAVYIVLAPLTAWIIAAITKTIVNQVHAQTDWAIYGVLAVSFLLCGRYAHVLFYLPILWALLSYRINYNDRRHVLLFLVIMLWAPPLPFSV